MQNRLLILAWKRRPEGWRQAESPDLRMDSERLCGVGRFRPRNSSGALAVLLAPAPAVANAQTVTVEIDNARVRLSRVNLAPHEKPAMREYPATVAVT